MIFMGIVKHHKHSGLLVIHKAAEPHTHTLTFFA